MRSVLVHHDLAIAPSSRMSGLLPETPRFGMDAFFKARILRLPCSTQWFSQAGVTAVTGKAASTRQL